MRFIVSFIAVTVLCSIGISAQDAQVKGLSVPDPATTFYNYNTQEEITYLVDIKAKNGGPDVVVTGINIYLCTYETYSSENASDPFTGTFDGNPMTITAGNTEDDIVVNITMEFDETTDIYQNCEDYTHVCVFVVATGETEESTNSKCIGFGTATSKAGIKTCPPDTTTAPTGDDANRSVAGLFVVMIGLIAAYFK